MNSYNSSLTDLGGFKPVIDETTGEITGYKTTIGGADTVFPFSRENIKVYQINKSEGTFTCSYDLETAYYITARYGGSSYPTWCKEASIIMNIISSNNVSISLYKFNNGVSKEQSINASAGMIIGVE